MTTVKTNAALGSAAKTVTDALSSDGTNVTATVTGNVTGNINGTAASTIRSRATTAVSETILYADSAQAGSSSGNEVSALPEYRQQGLTYKSKVVFLYKHQTNNLNLNLSFLGKCDGTSADSGQEPKVRVGYLPVSSSLSSTFIATPTSANFMQSSEQVITLSTGYNEFTKTLNIDSGKSNGLINGDLYEVHIQLIGGDDGGDVVTGIITGLVVTATGS